MLIIYTPNMDRKKIKLIELLEPIHLLVKSDLASVIDHRLWAVGTFF